MEVVYLWGKGVKRLILLAIAMFSLGELSAALPPFAESKREIEAILSSQEINHYLPSSDIIHQIIKTPSGYMIITNNRILPVSIRYMPRQNYGPARFAIRFHKVIETSANKPGEEEFTESNSVYNNR